MKTISAYNHFFSLRFPCYSSEAGSVDWSITVKGQIDALPVLIASETVFVLPKNTQ